MKSRLYNFLWNNNNSTHIHTLCTEYLCVYGMNMGQTLSERVLNDANISLWIAQEVHRIYFAGFIPFSLWRGEIWARAKEFVCSQSTRSHQIWTEFCDMAHIEWKKRWRWRKCTRKLKIIKFDHKKTVWQFEIPTEASIKLVLII